MFDTSLITTSNMLRSSSGSIISGLRRTASLVANKQFSNSNSSMTSTASSSSSSVTNISVCSNLTLTDHKTNEKLDSLEPPRDSAFLTKVQSSFYQDNDTKRIFNVKRGSQRSTSKHPERHERQHEDRVTGLGNATKLI